MTETHKTMSADTETPETQPGAAGGMYEPLAEEHLATIRADVAEYRVRLRECQADHWHSVTCLPSEDNNRFDGCNTAEELLDCMVDPLLKTLDAETAALAELDREHMELVHRSERTEDTLRALNATLVQALESLQRDLDIVHVQGVFHTYETINRAVASVNKALQAAARVGVGE